MLQEESLTLAHPAVRAAKARWVLATKHGLVRCSLTFEELFKLLKENTEPMKKIARRAGISDERLRELDRGYFRNLLGGRSGRDRRFFRAVKGRITATKDSERALFADPVIRAIAQKARRAGCTVQTIPRMIGEKLSGKVMRKTLLINGRRCSAHNLTRTTKPNPRSECLYARTTVSRRSLWSVEALIVRTAIAGFPERIFVIPSKILEKTHLWANARAKTTICFPVESLPVCRKKKSLLDMERYKNAWYLLPLK